MKPRHLQPAHLALAALAAAMVVAAPAAHAFTYETKNYNNGDDKSIFLDPDKKVEQFGNGNVRTEPGRHHISFQRRAGERPRSKRPVRSVVGSATIPRQALSLARHPRRVAPLGRLV